MPARQIVFDSMTALSLLLCIATAALWAATWHSMRGITPFHPMPAHLEVWSAGGVVALERVGPVTITTDRVTIVYQRTLPAVPHMLIFVAFAILPAWWFLAWRRRLRRMPDGLCRNCGYDLRMSTDRCPECGKPSPKLTHEQPG